MRLSKKRIIIFQAFLLILILSIFLLIILYMRQFEKEIFFAVRVYGYVAIFVISFLLDILMQPLGPDLPLIVGIVSGLNVFVVLAVTTVGSWIASLSAYKLGDVYGEIGIKKIYGEKRYKKWTRLVRKYGRLVVVIGALTPVPYVPVCWMAGMFKMKMRQFIPLALGSRTLRFIGIAFLVTYLSSL